jgi:hypothetical protein
MFLPMLPIANGVSSMLLTPAVAMLLAAAAAESAARANSLRSQVSCIVHATASRRSSGAVRCVHLLQTSAFGVQRDEGAKR